MLPDLQSSVFTYTSYKPELLSLLPRQHEVDLIDFLMKIEKYAIGSCDGSLLEYRPRTGTCGVMFEYKDEKFWLHVEHKWLEATDELIWLLEQ